MKIAVRLDDITSTMDWEKFTRLENLLDQYHIVPLLGVVPDNRDKNLMRDEAHPDFTGKLQEWQKKGWSLAMHGWRHIYTTKKGGVFPLNHFGEFAGVDKARQSEMIRDGKEKLAAMGVKTDIFMAPGHSYDTHTLSALKEEGFRFVTDGFGINPYLWKGMIFLPIALQKNKDIKKPQGYTTLVFHTNSMNEGDFQAAERLFQEYEQEFIPYSDYLKAAPVRQTAWGRLKEYLLARLKHFLVRLRSGGQE
ncbi:MAG: DUF2334 domain-containing protein [Lachnospiraceae bacterium]|nr:DUF2334 domain-containing protein [Lachnospiraceae bacterium]